MTPNVKAKGIIIRNLGKKDTDMLKKLREDLNTKFNSVAVMAASHNYFELKAELSDSDKQIQNLFKVIENLKNEKEYLRSLVCAYFSFQEEKVIRDKKMIDGLKRVLKIKRFFQPLKGKKPVALSMLLQK